MRTNKQKKNKRKMRNIIIYLGPIINLEIIGVYFYRSEAINFQINSFHCRCTMDKIDK